MTGIGREQPLGRKPSGCGGIVHSEAKRFRELMSHHDSDPTQQDLHMVNMDCTYVPIIFSDVASVIVLHLKRR
jgi:hypothetical protein